MGNTDGVTGILHLSAGSSVVCTTWSYLGESKNAIDKVLIIIVYCLLFRFLK